MAKPLCVVLGGGEYPRPFQQSGFATVCTNRFTSELADADLVVFTGGSDVNPKLYGVKEIHPHTHFDKQRDLIDVAAFNAWKHHKGVKFAGICRGSQFLYAMMGGQLQQHIVGHGIAGTHNLHLVQGPKKGMEIEITSTHHQCWNLAHKPNGFTLMGLGPNGIPEVGLIQQHHMPECLLVQGHPEYMSTTSAGFQYYLELVEWFYNL
jgi:gamma-glutamyl-gamma-aminobutyrate hydrolase PuuD